MSEDAVKKVGECIATMVGESDKTADPAREQEAHLREWIQRDDDQRALRSYVAQMHGTAVWQVDAADALRRKSPEMAREVDAELWRDLSQLKAVLPLPQKFNLQYTTSASTASAVVSNARVYEALVAVRENETNGVQFETNGVHFNEINTHIHKYEFLTREQERAAEAGRRVGLLFPSLVQRFADVRSAIAASAADARTQEPTAMQMRTLLLKLEGELLDKARRHRGENMKWERMAERLSAPGRSVLRDEEATFTSIKSTLANIGKARGSAYAFDEVCTRFFDHIFIVCGEVIAASGPGA